MTRRAATADGWSFAVCHLKREFAVVRLLHALAANDEAGFIYGRDKDHKAGLCWDRQGYFGYLLWNHTDMPVLRQIFVVRERRRQGLASQMVRYWAERYAFPEAEYFAVESPNEKSLAMLVKLGYARQDEGGIIGVRCRFTGGF